MDIIRSFGEDNSFPTTCVATIGFFDGVHRGHQFLIEEVKELAFSRQFNSLLLTFPEHPRRVIHDEYQPMLLTTLDEKLVQLSKTDVDYCALLPFSREIAQLTACEFMEKILYTRFHVRVLVIGYDHRFGHNRDEGFDDYVHYGREIGMEVVQARECRVGGLKISSSVVRTYLLKGDVEQAAFCLGRPYQISGMVVEGHRVGRTIGFPTANMFPENEQKLIPVSGVYAVRVKVRECIFAGMLNIGVRPTFNNGSEKTIEVHLLNFEGDLYGTSIEVFFIKYLRGEQKFDSAEDLMIQLQKDREIIKKIILL